MQIEFQNTTLTSDADLNTLLTPSTVNETVGDFYPGANPGYTRSLVTHGADGGVIACSALKRRYRDQLRHQCPSVEFLHLEGGRDVIENRQASRPGHFMPASLLTSQFETLEPLGPDERGVVVDVAGSVDAIVEGYLAETRREEQ
jgi:gluconokinase